MTGNLEHALLDVRRAYRLLADYQQSLFELLGYIREHLGAVNYYHEYVYSQPKGLAGLDKRNDSGLRYLPFYDLAAIWLRFPGEQSEHWDNHLAGDLMFGAWVRSDTGFNKRDGSFRSEAVEDTRSELVLSVVVCEEDGTGINWYHNVWVAIKYPVDGQVNATDKPGYRCFAKAIPLAELADKASIDAALRTWCADATAKLGTSIDFHPQHL